MATAPDAGFRLGIDFGTSHTTAILRWPDGHVRPLLFDGSPLLPSAIFVESDGTLLVGRDAIHAARLDPARFEPTPKRRIQQGADRPATPDGPSTTDMVAAVLGRVRTEAERVATTPVADMEATLTHPAAWDIARITVLVRAARAAGLPQPRLVAEPVAAAGYFVATLGRAIPAGSALVVYDFGGGTFDASVVAPVDGGYEVLALDGLTDVGGVDIDAALLRHVASVHRDADPQAWQRLEEPQTPADRRHRRHLVEDVRAAKEMLSRATSATVPIPLLELEARVTRDEFDTLAQPLLNRTVATTVHVVQSAGVEVAAVLLVGGSSRIPLLIGLLREGTGIEPSTIDQPETVVAEGSIRLAAGGSGETRAGSAMPTPQAPTPPAPPQKPNVPPQFQPGRVGAPADPWAAAAPALPPTLIGESVASLPTVAREPRYEPPREPLRSEPRYEPRYDPRYEPRYEQPRHEPVRPEPTPVYRGRRRRRWPAVLGAMVAVAAIGVATALALPYLTGPDQPSGAGTGTGTQAATTPAGTSTSTKAPVVRTNPPAWVPPGWTKFVDDGERASVVAGPGNNGGSCVYPSAGVIHVTRAGYDVAGCDTEDFVRAFEVRDAAIEAEFGLTTGCGGMWMRTGATGYFVAVCSDGTVALHRLVNDPPSAQTQLGPSWRPGFNKQRVLVGLLASGTTLTLYIDGVAQAPVTDATIPKGRVALGGFGPHPEDRVDATITRFRAWQP